MLSEKHINEILSYFKYQNIFNDASTNDSKLCLFGFSQIARDIIDTAIIEGVDINRFIIADNNSELWNGSLYKGVRIIPPAELARIDSIYVFITAIYFMSDIAKQVRELKVAFAPSFSSLFSFELESNSHVMVSLGSSYKNVVLSPEEVWQIFRIANQYELIKNITNDTKSLDVIYSLCKLRVEAMFNEPAKHIYTPNQYFIDEILQQLTKHEVFVDAGAFDGDTIHSFLKTVNNEFEAIYSFELDKSNFSKLNKYVETLPKDIQAKIQLYNCGLSDTKQVVNYRNIGPGSHFFTGGAEQAGVESLDNLLAGKKVTFIKMDIEGSEMAALQGACNIIKKQKPKLAIACYHSYRNGKFVGCSDLFDIPAYIKSLVPEYQIYIRHHSVNKNLFETVCYAIFPHEDI